MVKGRELLLLFIILRDFLSTVPMRPSFKSMDQVQILRHHCRARLQIVMVDPVLAPCCGVSFERTAAEARAANYGSCYACGGPLEKAALVPNHSLRMILGNFGGGT